MLRAWRKSYSHAEDGGLEEIAEKELFVNGRRHRVTSPDDQSLLSVLIDELDLTGAKYGCGEGQSGACTVLIDKLARLVKVNPLEFRWKEDEAETTGCRSSAFHPA